MNLPTDDREDAENCDQNKPVRVDCGVRGECLISEKNAIEIAELWRAGKMIGGDEDAVRDALLAALERTMEALKTIRFSGYNDHQTAIWMQQVAAYAMEPDKWPKPKSSPRG